MEAHGHPTSASVTPGHNLTPRTHEVMTSVMPARRAGPVECDHCGRTAARAEMMADPDADSVSGWLCVEGHGCASPRPQRVTIAGREVAAGALAQAEASPRVRVLAEVELLFEGLPAEPWTMPTRERREVLRALRERLGRELAVMRALACGSDTERPSLDGARLAAQVVVIVRVQRVLSRWLRATRKRVAS